MKKTLFMLISGIFVIVAVGAVFMYMHMDTYAKYAIEKYGSAIMGTHVTVAKVEVSPTSGEGAVTRLSIGNPAGFVNDHALLMNTTSVKVDMKTLTSDVVIIDEVVMDNPDIIYEVGVHGNNFAVLRTNVNDYLAKSTGSLGDEIVDSKQIIVKNFYLRNGRVKVIAPSLQNKEFTVSLPTIHLSDLGRDEGKGNLPKIMQQVMTVVTNSVVSAVGNVTLDNFLKFLPNTVTGVTNGVLNDTSTAVQNIGEGLGEVFTGK